MDEKRLEELARLLEEVVEDNTQVVETIQRVLDNQNSFRSDMIREMGMIRDDFQGSLAYRTLKDLCGELIMPLGAMEAMLEYDDFSDPERIREHVNSLVITLHTVLSRMGAEKIPVSPGEDRFDPNQHLCVRLLAPQDSPFPSAPPRTVVCILEDGYLLNGKLLIPAKVEVQSEHTPE